MVRRINDQCLEDFDKPVTKIYMKRNRVANLNLMHDSPFAIDRQLEDQKFLMNFNKNPQASKPTKGNKLKSQKIISKASSPLSTKAHVLNKIVREASGIHTYALVPPIRDKNNVTEKSSIIDPETHPLLKPYRDQINRKPIMASFGHRPSSASRTFHPATMKIHLKKEEIVRVNPHNKNGFGLPAAVLSQLIHCPKLEHPTETANSSFSDSNSFQSVTDHHNLFLPPEDMDLLTSSSSITNSIASKRKNKKNGNISKKILVHSKSENNTTTIADLFGENERPQWKQNFSYIEKKTNEKFKLRLSQIDDYKDIPVKDRLTRFASLSVADSQQIPYCIEKQETDRYIHSHGLPPLSKLTKSQQANNPFFDKDLSHTITTLKKEELQREKRRTQRIQQLMSDATWASIPVVSYDPNTALDWIKSHQKKQQQQEHTNNTSNSYLNDFETYEEEDPPFENSTLKINTLNSSSNSNYYNHPTSPLSPKLHMPTGSSGSPTAKQILLETIYTPKDGTRKHSSQSRNNTNKPKNKSSNTPSTKKRQAEKEDTELQAAIQATKNGNEDALFQFFMRDSSRESEDFPQDRTSTSTSTVDRSLTKHKSNIDEFIEAQEKIIDEEEDGEDEDNYYYDNDDDAEFVEDEEELQGINIGNDSPIDNRNHQISPVAKKNSILRIQEEEEDDEDDDDDDDDNRRNNGKTVPSSQYDDSVYTGEDADTADMNYLTNGSITDWDEDDDDMGEEY